MLVRCVAGVYGEIRRGFVVYSIRLACNEDLRQVPGSTLRIGIDLGGTKIEVIVLAASGAELYRRRVATPQGDDEATLDTVVALVREAQSKLDAPASIGIVGGGLSNIDRLYRRVPALWGPHVFSDTVATRRVRNRHGDSSGVRCAAWLGSEYGVSTAEVKRA
jgi:predicted NBD/HSP70 family sugar kinase